MTHAHATRSLAFLCGLATLTTSALGAEVVEKRGRVEINWSAQKMRYYGESQMTDGKEANFKDAEQRARREGYAYLETAWQDAKPLADGGVAVSDKTWPGVAKALTQASHSFNTAYFADGKVRVQLEAPIAGAIAEVPPSKAKADAPKPEATGVVIQLTEGQRPNAVYRVELEDGTQVFSAEDVSAAAFRERSMGYWFKKAKDKELTALVGAKPVVLEGRLAGDGVVKVSRQAWEAAYAPNQKLFADAKIVLNLP